MAVKKGLGELLVKENLIDVNQLEQARKEQRESGGRLMSVLVKQGAIQDSELAGFIGKQYNLPTVDLDSFEIDETALATVNRQICEKHSVIPVQKVGRNLVVAFADPSNIYVKDDISLLTRMKVEAVVASETAIARAIEKYYGPKNKMSNIMSEMEESSEAFQTMTDQAEVVDQDSTAETGPIIKFVNAMLAEAIKLKASDIHIEPYEKRFRVRFRVDGTLIEKTQPPPGAAAGIVSRIKILSRMDIAERRKPQDGRLKVKLKNAKEVDFRVNALPTLFGEKVVLRLLDKSNLNVSMSTLGMEEEDLIKFKEAIYLPQGMVLITGPTGSGKSTTIYSALSELNTPYKNISTAEDPVEYNVDGINQVQVNAEIGFDFPMALKAFLRQDPEIIMVGEIRDMDTASIAFKAASTGHMVVSTLHTNDAAATVTRLLDMGIASYVVAESTTLVVAQRLIKSICAHCKVDHKVVPKVLLELGVKEEELDLYSELKRGEGCSRCHGTGMSGRMAIFEVLKITPVIKEAIFKGKTPLELKRIAIDKGGMNSLRKSALLKLMRGETTVEEVVNSTIGDDIL